MIKRDNDERLPMNQLVRENALSHSVDDVCCSKFEKLQNRLEKKLAVYKLCKETVSRNNADCFKEDGNDSDGLSQVSMANDE